MKAKVEKVIIGIYDYDSAVLKQADGRHVELVFNKSKNIKTFDGKEVEIIKAGNELEIKEVSSSSSPKKK